MPEITVSEDERIALVELRETIRVLLDAHLHGEPDPEVSARLARIAAKHPIAFAVSDDGKLSLDLEPASSVGDVIAQMVGIVFQSQRSDEWQRLKICSSDECRWAFYDASRNRGGTWCKMEVCGNRIKNRRYRERSSRESG